MAEEEKNEETENEEPQAEEPADEAVAEEEGAGSDPTPEEASEPAADTGSDPSGSGDVPPEDAEPLDTHPKAVRKRKRAQFEGEAGPQRSGEERAAERVERRRQAAISRRRHREAQRAKRGEPGTGTPPAEREAAVQKVRQGIVLSSKGDKTITVKVEHVGRHRRYEKVVRRSRTLHAHDESNQANEGDVVRVVETRPLSKTKRWRLVEILERAR
jgi:small subunit ribosomal protein S17